MVLQVADLLVSGVEGHTLKVAEAYQRISRSHKRKEQAYDQLYVELDRLKENLFSIKTSWHKLVTNCCTEG